MPSAVLIFNTSSGTYLHHGNARDNVIACLEEGGVSVTPLEGSIGKQIAKSVETPSDMVVVAGGDGTIRSTIAAHRGGGRPIGIIPGGTMNLLAHDYGIPIDPIEATKVITGGHTREVDYATIGDNVFLHAAFTGLPVRIGVHREHRRGRMRMLDRIWLGLHALATLPRDPNHVLTATTPDGETRTMTARSFAIVVGTLDPMLLPVPHRASVTGGKLTVFALHPESGVDFARLLVRGAFGALADDPHVEQLIVTSAEIRGPRRRLHAMLDGERVLVPSPCPIEVHSGEVSVFAKPDVQEVHA
ncbi:diacylglycerol/lipid kinase family protein [Acuticoccus kandeliae]|uniref:diacylglycerol/lipid kinase family protein n=1 Tax=Acuticoccus kandeliae TaxID=2073160 RepID=UPI000D3E2CE1|nr:diacylglycerol kinase family protein [Acuticoccus kandeliae]